jgi:DNA-binding transcriptional regulator LsrR (DeoR family)
MAKRIIYDDRLDLLADVAEMYFIEGKNQEEISSVFGITRSAISRILTEARQKGIIEVTIHRKLNFNNSLEKALKKRFGLKNAHIVNWHADHRKEALMKRIGLAAGKIMEGYISNNQIVGVAWGHTVAEAIESFSENQIENVKVVQLVGVLGSSLHTYSGQSLVEQLAQKVGGEGVYLFTPFIVKDVKIAKALLQDPSSREAITLGQKCDIAILGVGTTVPEYCSLYQGGYITESDLTSLQNSGAVGDVGGHYFDINGKTANNDFNERMVGISKFDLKNIPTRIGIAGGTVKTDAIYGAIKGGYINVLVSDSLLAENLLNKEEKIP